MIRRPKEGINPRLGIRKDLLDIKHEFTVLLQTLGDLTTKNKRLAAFYCEEMCKQYMDEIDSISSRKEVDMCLEEDGILKSFETKLDNMQSAIHSIRKK